ncbi:MAG: hypothetical protein AAGU05_05325, partial [Anaerolineaceae bacterium]
HTPGDAIDLIDPGQLEIIGNMLDVFITRTAAEGIVWPFDRSTGSYTADPRMSKAMRSVIELIGEDPALAE